MFFAKITDQDDPTIIYSHLMAEISDFNGSQLAKKKKSIPVMSLP